MAERHLDDPFAAERERASPRLGQQPGAGFNFLPTDTSVSLGADISSSDDKWLRTLSAEQKLLGGPFSVTGSVSETAGGELSKSLRAGFKRSW